MEGRWKSDRRGGFIAHINEKTKWLLDDFAQLPGGKQKEILGKLKEKKGLDKNSLEKIARHLVLGAIEEGRNKKDKERESRKGPSVQSANGSGGDAGIASAEELAELISEKEEGDLDLSRKALRLDSVPDKFDANDKRIQDRGPRERGRGWQQPRSKNIDRRGTPRKSSDAWE